MSTKTMLFMLFFLGVSLAKEQTETFQPTVLRHRLMDWAEQTAKAAATEVRKAASQLQQVVTLTDNPDVQSLAKLYKENHHIIHHCDFASELGYGLQGLPSCINVTGDIANVELLAESGYELAGVIFSSVDYVLTELNTCSQDPIWKEITCYKSAFLDIQNDMKVYSTECNSFLTNATIVLEDIGVDVKNCFSFSQKFSAEWVETRIELCKQDLRRDQP